jgi:hypothetical protein
VQRVFSGEVLKRVRTYPWGKEVVPGSPRRAQGHTFGHTSYVGASGNESVCVQSDVTHVPFLFVLHSDWHAFYDQDGQMAQDTTCSRPRRCACRAFIIHSRRSRMW